jgi:hypothetical protein
LKNHIVQTEIAMHDAGQVGACAVGHVGRVLHVLQHRPDQERASGSRVPASAQRIAITISNALQPVLAAIAPHIEKAAVWFGEFAKNNTWLGPALAATAVALTTAGTALVAIGIGATALASVVTALGTLVGFAPMLPPIAAALVGIAAGLTVLKGLTNM